MPATDGVVSTVDQRELLGKSPIHPPERQPGPASNETLMSDETLIATTMWQPVAHLPAPVRSLPSTAPAALRWQFDSSVQKRSFLIPDFSFVTSAAAASTAGIVYLMGKPPF
jgi:hypothetical protein